VYAFIISVFYYKDMKLNQVKGVLVDSARITAMLMFIIAGAYLFKTVITYESIPQEAAEWIVNLGLPAWGFLIAMNILLLIAGNFMEPTSVVLVLTPLLFPIALELGIDPIHLGVVMVLNMQIGLVSPPVGLNLFVTSSVSGLSLEKVIKSSLPWLLVLLFVLILITYIPWFSLALPRALGLM
jgi:C4-dicarboxylate transporter DctM subunit